MSTRRVLVLGLAFFALAGCGRKDAPATGVVAVPRLFLTAGSEGGFVLRDATGAAADRALCSEFHAVRAPAVDWQAERFCFLGQAEAGAPWRLYRRALSEGARAEALEAVVDPESAPAWLPDGRIVVSVPAGDASRALFVVADGEPPERITFSGTDARDPCVVRDGRILYAGMRTTPEGTRAPALFSVHPDGVGMLLFHGATAGAGYARPRQGPGGDVVFLVTDADGVGAWLALTDGGALRALGDAATPRWTGIAHVAAATAGLRPQGTMSMVQAGGTTGSLLCIDARRGVEGPPAAFARLFARTLQPDGGAYAWEELGRVALEADGSFFATVPADTPLRLDVLGPDGGLLRASRTPFWVRPGEVRGCTGCHDAPDTTPPNVQPAAVRADPVLPKPAKEGS